jgi:hypothetical protein
MHVRVTVRAGGEVRYLAPHKLTSGQEIYLSKIVQKWLAGPRELEFEVERAEVSG